MLSAELQRATTSIPAASATIGKVFLTVDEAAHRLGVTRSWILRAYPTQRDSTSETREVRSVHRTGPPCHCRCGCDRGTPLSQAGHIVRPGGARKTWSIVYRDPLGVQQWEGKFKTRHDAQKRLNEVLGEIDKGTYTQRSSVTFEKFAEIGWRGAARSEVAQRPVTARSSTGNSYRDWVRSRSSNSASITWTLP